MDTSLAERTTIIRGAEALYKRVKPDSLVFSRNIQVTWITDPNSILAVVAIDVNSSWGTTKIEILEAAVADYASFLKLFGACLLMTFRNTDSEFSDLALSTEEIEERNAIHSGLNFNDALSIKWRDIVRNRRHYRMPKWVNAY